MEKRWAYKYGINTIIVLHSSRSAKLIVNNNVQDEVSLIIDNSQLIGTLPCGKRIKAVLHGSFALRCSLYINNELQRPIDGI